MTEIVKTITRFVGSTILLFGIYIVLHGHTSHGGGFAGGVIIASSFILLTLAHGKDIPFKIMSKQIATTYISIGALIFMSMALLGYTKGQFFVNFLPKGKPFEFFSAGTIPISDFGVGISVFAAVFMVFMVLSIFRIDQPGGKK
ncbi:MAG: MnhB domain-containing protein [bacterium]